MAENKRTMLTPPEVARLWGISSEKVRRWIETGELRAINVAKKSIGRPRYRIEKNDLIIFQDRRTATVKQPKAVRNRRKSPGAIIQFF